MAKAATRGASTNPVEVLSCFWLEVAPDEHRMVTSGMCCKFEGRKGIYRIIGMRHVRATDEIVLHVRKELRTTIGKMRFYNAEDMIWLEPPYNVPW